MTHTTDRVVSRSLNELVEFGLFVHTKITDGRGRPKSEYTCSLRLTNLLQEKCRNAVSTHGAKIDYVLSGASGKNYAELNITNRLLIALLLTYADRFGVVRNVGLSDLSKQTGLNRERVKAQINKAHYLGVIRTSVPGTTTPQLFGPTKSIYFLNLHSTVLNQGGPTAIVLIRTSENDRELVGRNEASWIIQAADICNGGAFDTNAWIRNFLPYGEKFDPLATLFYPRAKNIKNIPLLQTKIEEYASTLLSKHWTILPESLLNTQYFFLDKELIEHIRKDFTPPNSNKTKELLNERTSLLTEFIYHVSFLLACRTKRIFPLIEHMSFKKIDFLILPSSSLGSYGYAYTGSRALLVIPSENLSERLCYVIRRNENGKFDYEEFTHEEDIAIEKRFQYGLLSKNAAPKRYGQRDQY